MRGEMLGGRACGGVGDARAGLRRLLLAAGLVALCAQAATAQTKPSPQDLADQAIRRLDLQTELPRDEEEDPAWTLNLPPETIWVVVVIGLAILAYAFRDMIPGLGFGLRSDFESGDDGGAPGRTIPRAPDVVLGAADALAAEGRFAEAMHVLLLQALAAIRRRLEEPFADSLTSREILGSRRLSDALRMPLRDVVHRVEWTYFGEYPAAEADYLACRASFHALAQALQARAAA